MNWGSAGLGWDQRSGEVGVRFARVGWIEVGIGWGVRVVHGVVVCAVSWGWVRCAYGVAPKLSVTPRNSP